MAISNRIFILVLIVAQVKGCAPPSPLITTPRPFRPIRPITGPGEVREAIKAFGGNVAFDGFITDETADGIVRSARDLDCRDFDDRCQWRNERGAEGDEEVDELDFVRARGTPDRGRLGLIFGTDQSPDGRWAVTGTPRKRVPADSALFVSDPIECIDEDGELSFRYWTSPGSQVRACTRSPGDRKRFDFCSRAFSSGDPGPAQIRIPGPIREPFELVIEAMKFDFQVGSQAGGAVILDDISYRGRLCDGGGGGGGGGGRPRPRPATRGPPSIRPDVRACEAVKCTFDTSCYSRAGDFLPQIGPTGNFHTGIREPTRGAYGVAQGPLLEGTLVTNSFFLTDPTTLGFCYYRASVNSDLKVFGIRGGRRVQVYDSGPLPAQPHEWICEESLLGPGEYDGVEFVAENLRNRYSYMALDEVTMLQNGRSVC